VGTLSNSGSLEGLCAELRLLIDASVRRNLSEGILLSGGLDTSVLAVEAARYISQKSVTVALEGAEAPDPIYAEMVAGKLGLEHHIYRFSFEELSEVAPEVIRVMRTFDPVELRNDLSILVALRYAAAKGVRLLMTGDGSDELFAGYSFLFNLQAEELKLRLREMWRSMSFASVKLARSVGVDVRLPFLDPSILSFAERLELQHLVQSRGGERVGKWILRKTFEGLLPEEVVWRVKTPIEQGSGTSSIANHIDHLISSDDFEMRKARYVREDGVRIRSKEQLFFYEMYREVIGVPHPENPEGRRCPDCNSNIGEKSNYCRTCGAAPI